MLQPEGAVYYRVLPNSISNLIRIYIPSLVAENVSYLLALELGNQIVGYCRRKAQTSNAQLLTLAWPVNPTNGKGSTIVV